MRISPRFFFGVVERDVNSIPTPIKIIVFALFIHSVAWGVLEPLEAIYFNSFVSSYFEIGVIFASFNVVLLLLAIPGGALSDRVKATKLVIFGLLMYPIIGTLYFTATKAIHLFLARILNGVGATLVWISGESFIRKRSPENKSAETFGLYSTATNFALVVGAIAGSFIVGYFKISQLFLLLIPVPIIASFVVWGISKKKKKEETIVQGIEEVVERDGIIEKELVDFVVLGLPGFYCLLIAFFGGFFYNLLLIFIPLTAQHIQIRLSEILLLYALAHIPLLIGFFFSELADRLGKVNFIFLGFALATIVLPLVYFLPANTTVFIAVCFFFGLSLAMIGPAMNGIVTDITPKKQSGEITGTINAAFYFGGALGPLFFGALSDYYGLFSIFLAGAIITAMLAIITFGLKGFLSTKKIINTARRLR